MDVTPFLFKAAAVHLFKSRLQLNHVPVHETHSVKARKITTTSKILSLPRMHTLYLKLHTMYPELHTLVIHIMTLNPSLTTLNSNP
jgi:hypothetical protein